jgi:hypothetical protein
VTFGGLLLYLEMKISTDLCWTYFLVCGNFNERQKRTTMTFKNKFAPTFITAITLTFFFAIGLSNVNKNISVEHTLTIDAFSNFPSEIDGCSCYFSNNSTEFKNGKYIYMNDLAQTSFLKINGVLTKFIQTDFKVVDKKTTFAKSKSNKYEMTIEVIHCKQSGYETSLQSGTIKLMDKNGNSIKRKFYGECGC